MVNLLHWQRSDGVQAGAGNGDGGELTLLQTEARAKEEAKRGNESAGASRASAGVMWCAAA